VPILVPILVLLPYVVAKSYKRSHQINQIIKSLTQGSRDLEQMTRLLEGPVPPWTGETPEEVRTLDEPDLTGFEVLQDMRILDLRTWNPDAPGKSDPSSMIYCYWRSKVFKKPESTSSTGPGTGGKQFRARLLSTSPLTQVRFPPQPIPGKALMCSVPSSIPGQRACHWEASFDFEKEPSGDYVDLIVEYLSPGQFLQGGEGWTTLNFEIRTKISEMTRWILLPKGREYRNFRIIRYKTGKPDKVEPVKIVSEYLAEDFTILAYKLMSVDAGYTYALTWYYK
jgi:hypothetical protein